MGGKDVKRVSRKFISLCVAVLVLFTMTIPVYAQLSDSATHWAAPEISKWVEKGIIKGYPDGTYKPEKSISRAEFSSIISKLFNYIDKSGNKFSDVSSGDWYNEVVSKAAAAGVIIGDQGKFRPKDSISRQEAAVIIYRAFIFKVKDTGAANKFADAKNIATWAKDAVSAIVENNYMVGRPGNQFAPLADVTRAEAVKIIDNIVQDIKNTAGTYTGTFDKSLVVNAGDITLKDVVINGDLILAQGIADRTVNLDNVKVKGRTVVLGGGENSIILNNTSLEGTLVIIKKDGKVRIVAKGSTVVSNVQLNSGVKLEEDGITGAGFGDVEVIEVVPGQQIILDGDFEDVTVKASGAAIQVIDGKVGNLEVASGAAGATVQINSGASVTNLNANASIQVTGQGQITTANINAVGVTIEQKPANTNVAAGITATVAGSQTTGTTTTTTTTTPTTDTGTTSSITSVSLTTKDGGLITGAVSGTTYTFDLTSTSDSTYINGLKINSSPAADKLVVSDVSNQVTGTNGTFAFTGNNSIIDAFFGVGFIFDGDVSVQTIKSILSGIVTRNVSVYNGSTLIKNITLTIKISEGGTLGAQSLLSNYTISASNGYITAILKSGKEAEPVLTGTQFYQLLKDMITVPAGYSYSGVAIGTLDANYSVFETNSVSILQTLATQVGKGINEIKLGDLQTEDTTIRVKASKPSNADLVITVVFKYYN